MLRKEKDAWDGVRDARSWVLSETMGGKGEGVAAAVENAGAGMGAGWRAGGWSRNDVALELGGILKAVDLSRAGASSLVSKPPPSHRMFSYLPFVYGKGGITTPALTAADVDGGQREGEHEDDLRYRVRGGDKEKEGNGWLENDDIEEF